MEELVAMKKTSLDRQKTIDRWVKQTQAERKDHSKLSMMGQTLDAEKTTLNKGRKEGVDQRKVWGWKSSRNQASNQCWDEGVKGGMHPRLNCQPPHRPSTTTSFWTLHRCQRVMFQPSASHLVLLQPQVHKYWLWTQWQQLWSWCQCWSYCSIIKHTMEEWREAGTSSDTIKPNSK